MKSSSQAAILRLRRKDSALGPSDQIMGHVLDRGEVGGRMIGSDAAFIVTEDHVHHPVEAVLNGPMTSDDRSDLVSEPDQRGEIEARFALDLVDEFAGALDHDDRFETGPIMAFLQPIDIMEDRVRPGFRYGRGRHRRFDRG